MDEAPKEPLRKPIPERKPPVPGPAVRKEAVKADKAEAHPPLRKPVPQRAEKPPAPEHRKAPRKSQVDGVLLEPPKPVPQKNPRTTAEPRNGRPMCKIYDARFAPKD